VFFFLAFRNITKNAKDYFLIAILIAVITFFFFIGNSIIGKVEKTIRVSFVESLTGDVVLQKKGDVTMNLFGANAPVIDSFFDIPVLPAYNAVMNIVRAEKEVEGITSQVSGSAFLDILGVREPALLCGIDPSSYFEIFKGIIIEEGSFLQTGKYGAMITEERAKRIEQASGQRPQIGASLLFTSGGAFGFKIREVPLVGIFRYQNPGQFMSEIVIIDPQTVRVLNSIQVASNTVTESSIIDFPGSDIDDIFSEAFSLGGETGQSEEFSAELLQSFLSKSCMEEKTELSGGDWNFIILRLKEGVSANAFISSLNKKINGYGLTAVNWRIAAGTSAILTLLLQALFNSGIFLVSVVGIIAGLNILLISVFRRVREIGTLRAIGAPDSYIRSLIYSENLFISVIAGFAGVLAGFLFMRQINSLNIHISNELISSIFNGSILRLEFMPSTAVLSFVIAVFLGLAASVYPVETAVRIEPEAAVRRG